MTTAALASQTQFIHRTTLGSLGRRLREIEQLPLLRTTIGNSVAFDHLQEGQPFPSNRKVTRIAANGDWEVHDAFLSFSYGIPFFFSTRKNNMKKQTRVYVLVALTVAVLIGFAYTLMPSSNVVTRMVQEDVVKDSARFTPTDSVDVAMAMKLVTHEPPRMLAPPAAIPPLLLFPPSAQDLERLSGPMDSRRSSVSSM